VGASPVGGLMWHPQLRVRGCWGLVDRPDLEYGGVATVGLTVGGSTAGQ
jgi:hypothetical protein